MSRMPLLGLELAIKKAASSALKKAANLLKEKMQENVSLIDHDIKDLRKLGHPYSSQNPKNLHRPNFQVHRQEGDLYDSITINHINQYRALVGVDESVAPHAAFVILGTSKMVGRNFVSGSFLEIEEELTKIFEDEFSKEIKKSGS